MNFITSQAANSAQAAANLSPSTMSAQTVLAEDTIFGTVMDIKSGKGTTALFANPLNGDKEEMLYIDEANKICWIRHSNGQYSSPGSQEQPSWAVETVAEGYSSVVVAVQPDGTVWAFAIATATLNVSAFVLKSNATAAGGARWTPFTLSYPMGNAGTLEVRYQSDGTSSPLLILARKDGVVEMFFPLPPQKDGTEFYSSWGFYGSLPNISSDDVKNYGCAGAKGAPDSKQTQVWLYTLDPNGKLMQITGMSGGVPKRNQIVLSAMEIAGACNTRWGTGCVATLGSTNGEMLLGYVCPADTTGFYLSTLRLDQPLDDVNLWQDAKGLMHVYGRGADGGLYVVHQLGWCVSANQYPATVPYEPVWEQHVAQDGKPSVTTRALIANAASFNLDCFPDEMPNQHVMHAGVAAGEMCAFYSQSLNGSYWAKEKVRLEPAAGTKPYIVKRYQTVVTVKNAYGAPCAGVELSLTASAPSDLQVNGLFYRPGPHTPVRLRTDGAGRVILRVMAEGLYQPTLHITGIGITDSLSVDPAAVIQKYLGGSGTLLDRPEGFTADTVKTAKKPDGSFLFATIDRGARGVKDGTWPPTAQELVSWCQSAFQAQANGLLMVDDPRKAGVKIKARAISFQVHDRTRPAYQEHTNQVIVAGHNQRLAALQYGNGFTDSFGDLLQGIRSGLTEVAEIFIDLETKAMKILVMLKDKVVCVFESFYHTVQDAAQAIEAAFVAVKAFVNEVINYLSWLFQFKDVWNAKKALESGFQQTVPWIVKNIEWIRVNGDGWFIGKEKAVAAAFEAMKQGFAGKTMGTLQAPANVNGPTSGQAAKMHDVVGSGHAHWVTDNLNQSMRGAAAWKRKAGPKYSPFDRIIEDITNSPAWDELGPMFTDVGELFANLFSFDDPATAMSREIFTILDLFEHLTLAGLKLGGTIFDVVLDFVEAMVMTIYDYLNEDLDIPLLQTIYEFIQEQAGVKAEDYEKLTVGHMGVLIPAFVGTIAYKAIFQAVPFPDGTFPNIFPKTGEPAAQHVKNAGGTVIYPTGWLSGLCAAQFYGSAMMAFDAIFDGLLNATAAEGDMFNFPPIYYKVWAANHFVAYGILDLPLVWGNRFPKDRDDESVGTILPTLMWIISFFANGADVGVAWEYGYFITQFEKAGKPVGATVFALGGLARTIMSGVRYQYSSDKGTPNSITNCAINVTSFFSATTGFVRSIYKTNPEAYAPLLAVKTLLDVVCDGYAGIASVYQIYWENKNPPKILDEKITDGVIGEPYSYQFTGQDGTPPYSWESAAPDGTDPSEFDGLPPGLALDANTGILTGTPTAAGKYRFRVKMGDDYGPTVYYLTDNFTLEVWLA